MYWFIILLFHYFQHLAGWRRALYLPINLISSMVFLPQSVHRRITSTRQGRATSGPWCKVWITLQFGLQESSCIYRLACHPWIWPTSYTHCMTATISSHFCQSHQPAKQGSWPYVPCWFCKFEPQFTSHKVHSLLTNRAYLPCLLVWCCYSIPSLPHGMFLPIAEQTEVIPPCYLPFIC